MSEPKIDLAVTIYAGCLQTLGSSTAGVIRLRRRIELELKGRVNTRVGLYTWNTNESDVAESLWRDRPENKRQLHVVIGYSYGGDRAVKFCKELENRTQCCVTELHLCDAVRRWDYLPGIAASVGVGKLWIPPIVNTCVHYIQEHSRWALNRGWKPGDIFQPAGHTVKAVNKDKTNLIGPILRSAVHGYIDNDADFHQNAIDAVRRALTIELPFTASEVPSDLIPDPVA